MSSGIATHRVRGIGILVTIAGLIFAVVGVGAWIFTTVQLSAQNITVPADAPSPWGGLAGTSVNNPLSAMAQAATIGMHQEHGAESALAEAGVVVPAGVGLNFAGLTASNFPDATQDQLDVIAAQRTTAQTAAGLQSSLFTSVLAYGVSLFAFGVGVVFVLIGLAYCRIARGRDDDLAFDTPLPAARHRGTGHREEPAPMPAVTDDAPPAVDHAAEDGAVVDGSMVDSAGLDDAGE
jgi:hypothetical protein